MKGTLLKWTNFWSQWQERTFILKGPIMSYFIPGDQSKKPKVRFFVGLAEVIEPEPVSIEYDEFAFEIETGANHFYLKAKNKKEKQKWISEIKKAKVLGEKMIKNADLGINNDKYEQFKKFYQKNIKDVYPTKEKKILNEIDKIISSIDGKERLKDAENNRFSGNKIMNNSMPIQKSEENISTFTESGFILKGEEFFDLEEQDKKTNNRKLIQNSLKIKDLQENENNNLIKNKFENSFYDPLYDYKKRVSLPVPCKKIDFNAWEILKGSIGKDINKIALPVFLNEPVSMLQKLCENFQYADILNKAAKEPDPYMRLAYVACFNIGGLAMSIHRTKKFFNPILFETYEYIDNELNYRYFAEQVSHHPAISAFFAEGDGWTIFTNNNSQIKFSLSGTMEGKNLAKTYVHFSKYNEEIYYTKPLVSVKNLIFGEMYYDVYDKFIVGNYEGGECSVEIFPSDSPENIRKLQGIIKDAQENIKYKLEGNWLDKIKIVNVETKEEKVIWKIIKWCTKENYYFQPITFDLNNLTKEMEKSLPKTDSRFRGDQRLMEYQKIDEAKEEKLRLENKQRKARKKDEMNGIHPKPRFFEETYDDITGELIYKYKGNYFENRKNHKIHDSPDLFGK